MTDSNTINLLIPEILLVLMATWIYVGGAFFPSRKSWSWTAAGGIALAAVALYRQQLPNYSLGETSVPVLLGPIVQDGFGLAVRFGILIAGFLFVLLSSQSEEDPPTPEYTGSLLLVLAGLMITSVAADLTLLFLGLELVSIPTYVLLFLGRRDGAGQEATIKYFFLSILSSAILLYGFSFLYGVAGSTQLSALYNRLSENSETVVALMPALHLGLVLVMAGLAFRFAAVPFHFYAPDVYQGTSNVNAGLLSTMPKIAGLVAVTRVVIAAMPEAGAATNHFGWKLAIAMAIMSMTVGNLLALWQDNIRRLLAYSSIAHSGYILVGVAVALAGWRVNNSAALDQQPEGTDGLSAALFYLAVYVTATTGTFAALAYLSRRGRQVDGVDELAGLGRTHRWIAPALALFMFSMAGIPPLAGFWGKFSLFFSTLGSVPPELRNWFIMLSVVGVLNSAISLAYYLRVVSVMYFRPPLAAPKAQGGMGALAATLICAVLVLVLGVYPAPLARITRSAARAAMIPPMPPVIESLPAKAASARSE